MPTPPDTPPSPAASPEDIVITPLTRPPLVLTDKGPLPPTLLLVLKDSAPLMLLSLSVPPLVTITEPPTLWLEYPPMRRSEPPVDNPRPPPTNASPPF